MIKCLEGETLGRFRDQPGTQYGWRGVSESGVERMSSQGCWLWEEIIGKAREGLAGLCVDIGFHRMSEAFELRSGYSPSCLLANPLRLLCGGEREPGKKLKDG